MILLDVNVMVYAARRDAVDHLRYRRWLEGVMRGAEPVALAEESLAAVVRITTHRKIWHEPLTHDQVFAFIDALLAGRAATAVGPGPNQWEVFQGLCRRADARGNLVSDAWLAATAIEHNATLITTDRDFARFPGLRWRHPLVA